MARVTLLLGGRLVDPSQGVDGKRSLLVRDGVVEAVFGEGDPLPCEDLDVVDCSGLVVAPGLVDLHVHLRDPGQTEKEDIRSGCAAAAAGGFTSVFCMANTIPVNDSPQVTAGILERSRQAGLCRVYPVGAVTLGLGGEELSPMEDMKNAGCTAFSDDGRPVADPGLLREALRRAADLDVLFIEHCEAPDSGGCPTSRETETLDVTRMTVAAAEIRARVHLAHISSYTSIEVLRAFKPLLPRLSAEVTPHHLLLTEEAVERFGADAKMNPPLRERRDCLSLIGALCDGCIDAVATDHAPHTVEEKAQPFDKAPCGVIGLETALVLLLGLVEAGEIGLSALIDRMSTTPARIAGIPAGSLRPGSAADIVVFDPSVKRVIASKDLRSKSRNSPFIGFAARGRVLRTFLGGRQVYAHRP